MLSFLPWAPPPDRSALASESIQRIAQVAALAVVLVLGVVMLRVPDSERSRPVESPASASARSLAVSIGAVLDAARLAEETGPENARADARVEDAWRVLSLVYEREQAQLDVAAGRRPPLMKAPPPGPARPGDEVSFTRAALTYLGAAIPERDLDGLQRALTLIELGRG
jgi:hypothetical protein